MNLSNNRPRKIFRRCEKKTEKRLGHLLRRIKSIVTDTLRYIEIIPTRPGRGQTKTFIISLGTEKIVELQDEAFGRTI